MTTNTFNLSKHFPVLSSFMTYHRMCNQINTTGATSAAGTDYPSGASAFTPGFQWGSYFSMIFSFICNVLQFVVRPFSFGHCVVCSSSTYGFWLPLQYHQTFVYVIHVLIYPPQLEYNGDVIYLAHSPQVWLIVLIRRKSKYWFTGSHNEESEWSNIPTIGLLDNNMLFQ